MTELTHSFEKLYGLNVERHIEKKNGLRYLTWSFAWAEFKKAYPDAVYEVQKFNGLPYVESSIGLMCYTSVTANGLTHEMWLPVLDTRNNAMKSQPYEVQTRKGKVKVEAATMFDVNKALMRCLVKNLAMFGLGLYIYAGEDLPEEEKAAQQQQANQQKQLNQIGQQLMSAYNAGQLEQVGTLLQQYPQIIHNFSEPWQQAFNQLLCEPA